MATLRLLEISRDQPQPLRFYHASSSEIFGDAADSPQTEETPLRPASPYGCAKAFATQLARVYRQAYGLFVCNGILYNHESPRRGENFVTRKIARAAARISRGLEQEVVLGDVSARRDWGHARDYVEAMWLMLQHSESDDYVVATGETHSVQDFVEAAFAVVDLPPEKYVKHDASFERRRSRQDLSVHRQRFGASWVGNRKRDSPRLSAKWSRRSWPRSRSYVAAVDESPPKPSPLGTAVADRHPNAPACALDRQS